VYAKGSAEGDARITFLDMTKTNGWKVRALVFDLDGTLIDSKLDLANSVERDFARNEAEGAADGSGGELCGLGGASADSKGPRRKSERRRVEAGLAFFLVHYEEHKLDETRLYPGVAETLAELKSLPMSVLTNKPVKISMKILEGLGVSQYFAAFTAETVLKRRSRIRPVRNRS